MILNHMSFTVTGAPMVTVPAVVPKIASLSVPEVGQATFWFEALRQLFGAEVFHVPVPPSVANERR